MNYNTLALIARVKTHTRAVNNDIAKMSKYSGPLRYNSNQQNVTYKKDLQALKDYRKKLMCFNNELHNGAADDSQELRERHLKDILDSYDPMILEQYFPPT